MADPPYTHACEISSRRFILSPSGGEKNTIFAIFVLWHFVVSPGASNLRTLNTGAQLQTFPYPTASKSFCPPTPSWRNRAHKLTFKSMTNRQPDKQTEKQKTQRFWPPGRRVKLEPRQTYQTWHGDRGPRVRSCTSKTLRVRRIIIVLFVMSK